MRANPLKDISAQSDRPIAPSDPKERTRFWIDRGNRILWGHEPTSKGEWVTPRHDLEWVHRNGSYSIEPQGK
jgi:hypothetical protein